VRLDEKAATLAGRVQVALAAHRVLVDAAVAALVLAVSLPVLVDAEDCTCGGIPAWGYLLVVAQTGLLIARRRFPFLVGLAVGLLSAVYGTSSLPDPAVPFAGLVAFYSTAAYAGRRLAVLAALIAATVIAASLTLPAADATVQDWTINYLVFATAWLLGWTARTRREITAALEERAASLERTRRAEAERAVAEERTRIAREMHDVVAHAVSLMVVQAEAGPVVLPADPARATAAFDSISATGKEALTEMRRLLGVLRADRPAELAPQPGIGRLPALVASFRASGLTVGLTIDVAPGVAPDPSTDLSIYRLVQEALTNALKHSGATTVDVLVAAGPSGWRVRVTDDGPGMPGARTADPADLRGGNGNGLIGMRERVGLLGGDLVAGPRPGGGWQVEAELPTATTSAGRT
jgi:signal transduction histidine kinase